MGLDLPLGGCSHHQLIEQLIAAQSQGRCKRHPPAMEAGDNAKAGYNIPNEHLRWSRRLRHLYLLAKEGRNQGPFPPISTVSEEEESETKTLLGRR